MSQPKEPASVFSKVVLLYAQHHTAEVLRELSAKHMTTTSAHSTVDIPAQTILDIIEEGRVALEEFNKLANIEGCLYEPSVTTVTGVVRDGDTEGPSDTQH